MLPTFPSSDAPAGPPSLPAVPSAPPGTVVTQAPGWYQKPDGTFVNGAGQAFGPGVPPVPYVAPAEPVAPPLAPAPVLPTVPAAPAPLAPDADPLAAFRAPPVAPAPAVAPVPGTEPKRGPGRPRKNPPAEPAAAPAAPSAAPVATTYAPDPVAAGAAVASLDTKQVPQALHTRGTRIALALLGIAKAATELAEALDTTGDA